MTPSRPAFLAFRPTLLLATGLLAIEGGCATHEARTTASDSIALTNARLAAASEQVANIERAFAKTMTDHDLKGFLTFLSADATFFNGSAIQHGPAEIAAVWTPYFTGPSPPFSWRPDHVEVTADGQLALSTGPILQNGQIVGRFNSIWRLEAGNTWRIVFDKGEPVCGPARSVGAP